MAYSIEGTEVPNLTGGNSWPGTNAFNGKTGHSGLTASTSSLDAEGFPIAMEVSYTAGASAVTNNKVPYTSWTERTAGPAVIILSGVNALNANAADGYITELSVYSGPAGLGVGNRLIGDNVYNAVWNDMVDCIDVPEDTVLEPGYAYSFDGQNYHKTMNYLDPGFIGIHSDTYGFGTGISEKNTKQLYIAIAGFVLAYIDKDYAPGTPLTCTSNGYLTELKEDDLKKYPYLLAGTFWKSELEEVWGTLTRFVPVNGRKWMRVK